MVTGGDGYFKNFKMFFEQLRLIRVPVAERIIENQAQEPVARDTNRSSGAAGASPENRVAVESKATDHAATLPRDVCHGFLSSQNQTRKVAPNGAHPMLLRAAIYQ